MDTSSSTGGSQPREGLAGAPGRSLRRGLQAAADVEVRKAAKLKIINLLEAEEHPSNETLQQVSEVLEACCQELLKLAPPVSAEPSSPLAEDAREGAAEADEAIVAEHNGPPAGDGGADVMAPSADPERPSAGNDHGLSAQPVTTSLEGLLYPTTEEFLRRFPVPDLRLHLEQTRLWPVSEEKWKPIMSLDKEQLEETLRAAVYSVGKVQHLTGRKSPRRDQLTLSSWSPIKKVIAALCLGARLTLAPETGKTYARRSALHIAVDQLIAAPRVQEAPKLSAATDEVLAAREDASDVTMVLWQVLLFHATTDELMALSGAHAAMLHQLARTAPRSIVELTLTTIKSRSAEVMQDLLWQPDGGDRTPLINALSSKNQDTAVLMIDYSIQGLTEPQIQQLMADQQALMIAFWMLPKVVKKLVELGADIDVKDKHNRTPLHLAAARGKSEIVKLLVLLGCNLHAKDISGKSAADIAVEEGKTDTAQLLEELARSPLHWAATHGHVELTQFFLERSADVNKGDSRGETPLHLAAQGGHLHTASLLVEKGANVDKADKRNRTPLYFVTVNGHLELASLLVKHRADVNKGSGSARTLLHLAAKNGNVGMTGLLLDHGADVNKGDRDNQTPLHLAAQEGHLNTATLLVEKRSDVNRGDMWSRTPLYFVALQGHLELGSFLLEKLADANKASGSGRTPLHVATQEDNCAMVSLFVEKGADVNQGDTDDQTPLHLAAEAGQSAMAKLLVQLGARLDLKDEMRKSAADIAREEGHAQLERLLEELGRSPLHFAAADGNLNAATELLEQGAEVNAVSGSLRTPLHYAAAKGDLKMVTLLVQKHADINKGDSTPLHLAAACGKLEMVRLLVTLGANLDSVDQSRPLLKAAVDAKGLTGTASLSAEKIADTKKLLAGGRPEGVTPLHVAAENGQSEIAKLLLESGASLDIKDGNGRTPLHFAAEHGKSETAQLLLQLGASIDAKDVTGKSAAEVAMGNGMADTAHLLEELARAARAKL